MYAGEKDATPRERLFFAQWRSILSAIASKYNKHISILL
jgi:hypothetical protein